MLQEFFVLPIRNLLRGRSSAIFAAVIGVVVGLLFIVGVTRGQERSRIPNNRVQWKAETQWPGWIGLWIDGSYAGSLNPYEGKWWYQGASSNHDLIEFLDRNNPPKRRGERGDIGEKIGAKPKAGVREEDGDVVGDRRDQGPAAPLFGVVSEKIAPDGLSHYSIGGLAANRADALRAIEAASGIPDDKDKPRLIVIGTEVGRRKVIDDLARDPLFTFWRDKLVVLQYPPNHDAIAADRGFVQPLGDEPVIQVQRHNGEVYWRQETYAGGAPELAKALRDKVPGYDPARDPHPPDKGKAASSEDAPVGLIGAWLSSLGCPLVTLLLGGGAAGAYWMRKRKAGA